jgi:hypothetical protein
MLSPSPNATMAAARKVQQIAGTLVQTLNSLGVLYAMQSDGRIDFGALDPVALENMGIADPSFLIDLVKTQLDMVNNFQATVTRALGSNIT